MEALIQAKESCRLLRIDIDKWGSPVARQHGINSLPTVWLYDGSKRVSTDTRDALTRVDQLN